MNLNDPNIPPTSVSPWGLRPLDPLWRLLRSPSRQQWSSNRHPPSQPEPATETTSKSGRKRQLSTMTVTTCLASIPMRPCSNIASTISLDMTPVWSMASQKIADACTIAELELSLRSLIASLPHVQLLKVWSLQQFRARSHPHVFSTWSQNYPISMAIAASWNKKCKQLGSILQLKLALQCVPNLCCEGLLILPLQPVLGLVFNL